MKRAGIYTLVGMCVAALLGAPIVGADQTYHSERLDLWLTDAGADAGHPDLRSGHVVNIHPNGDVNGALERYMINGAKPHTSYQVEILAYEDVEGECQGAHLDPIPTTVLETNKQGKAQGKAHFSRADIDPFSGATLAVKWVLVADGVEAYESECTVVSID